MYKKTIIEIQLLISLIIGPGMDPGFLISGGRPKQFFGVTKKV